MLLATITFCLLMCYLLIHSAIKVFHIYFHPENQDWEDEEREHILSIQGTSDESLYPLQHPSNFTDYR